MTAMTFSGIELHELGIKQSPGAEQLGKMGKIERS